MLGTPARRRRRGACCCLPSIDFHKPPTTSNTGLPMSEENKTDYYLHVDIIVPENEHEKFEERAKKFLTTALQPFQPFLRYSKRANYALKLALRSDPFEFRSSGQAEWRTEAEFGP